MDTDGPAAAAPALGLIPPAAAAGPQVPTASAAARALFVRGLRIAWRRPADAAASAAFYVIVAGLFSLATAPLGAAPPTMAAVAAWIGALLAALLAQQGLREDAACGVLDQLRLAPEGRLVPVAALLLAQVVTTALPLLLATPLVALFFGLSAPQALALALSLLAGLPAVCVLAAFASALTLGSRTTPAALGLLVLPLAVPLLLFGVRAAEAGAGRGALLLLCACSLAAAALGPFALGAALSLAEDE